MRISIALQMKLYNLFKMSSWKDKAKSLFFEQENEKQSPVASQQPAGQAMQSSVLSGSEAVVSVISPGNVEIDEKLLDVLEQKIKSANIPGPDYLELKEAAEEKTLVADEPDERKRWRQAFRTMKVLFPQANLTKKKLGDAVNHYIGIIRSEINAGQVELKELKLNNVTKEHEAVQSLDKEIAALEKQLEAKKQLKDSKLAKIEEAQKSYEHQEAVFNRTTQFVLELLESDKRKINDYIED